MNADLVQFDYLGLDLDPGELAAQLPSGVTGRWHGPGLQPPTHGAQRADDLLMPRVNPAVRSHKTMGGQRSPLRGADERGE